MDRRHNGHLPKALVDRLGEDVVRKACGMGSVPEKIIRRRQHRCQSSQ